MSPKPNRAPESCPLPTAAEPGPTGPAPAADERLTDDGVVLASFLAQAGLGSRRACAELIQAGQVTVNGQLWREPGRRVDPRTAVVRWRGRPVELQTKRTFMVYKPEGYTCSASDPFAERLAQELLPPEVRERLFSVGRLDRDSAGLILFSNDGELANRLMHPRYEVTKEYLVWVHGRVSEGALRRLEQGLWDNEEWLHAKSVTVDEQDGEEWVLRFILGEGRKREIRRLCTRCHWSVTRLLRIRQGPLWLAGLAPGEVRELDHAELAELRASVGLPA